MLILYFNFTFLVVYLNIKKSEISCSYRKVEIKNLTMGIFGPKVISNIQQSSFKVSTLTHFSEQVLEKGQGSLSLELHLQHIRLMTKKTRDAINSNISIQLIKIPK